MGTVTLCLAAGWALQSKCPAPGCRPPPSPSSSSSSRPSPHYRPPFIFLSSPSEPPPPPLLFLMLLSSPSSSSSPPLPPLFLHFNLLLLLLLLLSSSSSSSSFPPPLPSPPPLFLLFILFSSSSSSSPSPPPLSPFILLLLSPFLASALTAQRIFWGQDEPPSTHTEELGWAVLQVALGLAAVRCLLPHQGSTRRGHPRVDVPMETLLWGPTALNPRAPCKQHQPHRHQHASTQKTRPVWPSQGLGHKTAPARAPGRSKGL